jgi:hypothetical protein
MPKRLVELMNSAKLQDKFYEQKSEVFLYNKVYEGEIKNHIYHNIKMNKILRSKLNQRGKNILS